MTATKILLCLFLTIGSLYAQAQSQTQTQSRCPTFYADYDQQGTSFQLCSSGNVPAQNNDQASSFVVPTGYSVTLFADYNSGGQSFGPYGPGSYNVPANFNDQLSSVTVTQAASSQCVTFYTDYDQQGNSFQLCSSGNVPAQYNDQASSFVVPNGYTVTLYPNSNFGGQANGPYGAGSYNVPAAFNDQLSSARVSLASNPRCATFYTDGNQQGNSFQLCSSGNVPAQYNDQASSFTVPAGYTVTLYANGNFGGQSNGPYTQGSYNVPAAFNDQLSSARISQAQNPTCPTFYADANQQGASFRLCSSGNVPAQYNDQASSFYVPRGYFVRLYSDGNYRGRSVGVYGAGSYNVPANFNDQLSSVVVTRR